MKADGLPKRIIDGRTDLVRDLVAHGHPATARAADGLPLVQWCAYYGNVSAIRLLLDHGESLTSLGENHGLHAAAFGSEDSIDLLLGAGAVREAKDENGDTPLSWAS